jgi:hypothetical protein
MGLVAGGELAVTVGVGEAGTVTVGTVAVAAGRVVTVGGGGVGTIGAVTVGVGATTLDGEVGVGGGEVGTVTVGGGTAGSDVARLAVGRSEIDRALSCGRGPRCRR